MRKAAIPLALALALAGVAPVFAGAGLPRLGELRAGPYDVALHNDSPTLVAGRNTLTLELPAAAATGDVRLALVGPNGQALAVPLRRVAVLGRAAEDHGAEADAHAAEANQHAARASGHPATADDHGDTKAHGRAAPTADDHGSVGKGHGADDDHAAAPKAPAGTAAREGDGHGDADDDHDRADVVLLRGAVDLPTTGSWRARLSLTGADGDEHAAETFLEAVDDGPNLLYLAATGSLIAGSLAVGAVGRRRSTATPPRR